MPLRETGAAFFMAFHDETHAQAHYFIA